MALLYAGVSFFAPGIDRTDDYELVADVERDGTNAYNALVAYPCYAQVGNYEEWWCTFTLHLQGRAGVVMYWDCDGGISGQETVTATNWNSANPRQVFLGEEGVSTWSLGKIHDDATEAGGPRRCMVVVEALASPDNVYQAQGFDISGARFYANIGEDVTEVPDPTPTPSATPTPSPTPGAQCGVGGVVGWTARTAPEDQHADSTTDGTPHPCLIPLVTGYQYRVTLEQLSHEGGPSGSFNLLRFSFGGALDGTAPFTGLPTLGGPWNNTPHSSLPVFVSDWWTLTGLGHGGARLNFNGEWSGAWAANARITVEVKDEDGNLLDPADSDGDGYTDEEEGAAGTDPNDPSDFPTPPTPTPTPTPRPPGTVYPAPDVNVDVDVNVSICEDNPDILACIDQDEFTPPTSGGGQDGTGIPSSGESSSGVVECPPTPVEEKVGFQPYDDVPTVDELADEIDGQFSLDALDTAIGWVGDMLASIPAMGANSLKWVVNTGVDFVVPGECLGAVVDARMQELNEESPFNVLADINEAVQGASAGGEAVPLPDLGLGGVSAPFPVEAINAGMAPWRDVLGAGVWFFGLLGAARIIVGSFGVGRSGGGGPEE